ncbi:hypothetical protein LTR17_005467 [Elasticomyces elasticus]|nr:hypothetical protein LTR17_005467 [Elasticomyces elasticus]
MSQEEKIRRLNEALKSTGENEAESQQGNEMAPWEVQSLIMALGVDDQERLLVKHVENFAEWQKLVGKVGLVDCGVFSKHSEFLRSHYGLQVFVAHRGTGDRRGTVTYLTPCLPYGWGDHQEEELELFDEKPEHQDVGFGVAREITAPEALTDGERARFVEMLTALAMPGWEPGGSDAEKQALLDRAAGTLTMLTHVRVEQCAKMHQEDRKVDARFLLQQPTPKHNRIISATMPEVTTRLAWALRVNAVDLVASIEIEAAFRLVADTLRLCNVFGKGEHADITRLPKELVDLIEEHLIAEKVAAVTERRAHCRSLEECFSSFCSHWEKHMTDAQKLEMVNEVLEEQGMPTVKSHLETAAQGAVHIINNGIMTYESDCWKPAHIILQDEWQTLVGKAGAGCHDQGMITKTRDFVLKHFGLEIFVAHKQNQMVNAYNTFAYLTLPDDPEPFAASQSYQVCVSDSKKDRPSDFYDYSPPEASFAHEVNGFRLLTKSEEDRFLKMLVSLRMPGWERTTSEVENQKLRARATPKPTILARAIQMDTGRD